jgi:hypothetical protein
VRSAPNACFASTDVLCLHAMGSQCCSYSDAPLRCSCRPTSGPAVVACRGGAALYGTAACIAALPAASMRNRPPVADAGQLGAGLRRCGATFTSAPPTSPLALIGGQHLAALLTSSAGPTCSVTAPPLLAASTV